MTEHLVLLKVKLINIHQSEYTKEIFASNFIEYLFEFLFDEMYTQTTTIYCKWKEKMNLSDDYMQQSFWFYYLQPCMADDKIVNENKERKKKRENGKPNVMIHTT